jgi:hypothetical protein
VTPDTEEITELRHEAEEKRHELVGDIEQLRERLAPHELAEQGRSEARRVAHQATERATESVKSGVEDPRVIGVAGGVAVVAVLAWWLRRRRRRRD